MPEAFTIREWLREAGRKIAAAGSTTPDFDAKLLLQEASGFSSVDLISRNNETLSEDHLANVDTMLRRRINGEPVHRILGWREFYGRRFILSDETLIPRPDTEALIELALRQFDEKSETLNILDIGTGSGIIAVTLAAELSNARVVATDISTDALATAEGNARALGVAGRVEFIQLDMFENVTGKFDLIVSNPPYIPAKEIDGLQWEVRVHDPYAALAGGNDGLDFYHRIFGGAKQFLKDNGVICVEMGAGQSDPICRIMEENGFGLVDRAFDLSNVERCLCGCLV